MNKQLYLFIILIFSCNLLFSSCKKEEEKVNLTNVDIEGKWKVDKYVVTLLSDKENVTMRDTNFTFKIDGTCEVNDDAAEYTDLFNYLFNLETWEINSANKSQIIFNKGTSLQRILTVKSISRSNMKMELIDSGLGVKIIYLMDFSR